MRGRLWSLWLVTAALAVVVCVSGCPAAHSDYPGKSCKVNADCYQGETCTVTGDSTQGSCVVDEGDGGAP